MTSRRDFLKLGLAVTATSLLPACASWQSKSWFVSCCTDQAGQHYVAAFDQAGLLINQFPIPARGHQVIGIPNKPGHALVFARRPGYYLMEVDFIAGEVVQQVQNEPGQYFYGHGAVTPDGKYLLTTENDYDNQRGLIVVRDLDTLKVESQFFSGGIGPHELRVMPDSDTIVVANGGILTHPSEPRKKLNLATMKPNLSYLTWQEGKLLDAYELDNHKLSIRHLDVSNDGKVVAGLQYQGNKYDHTRLVISHHGEAALKYLSAPDTVWRKMNQYVASVAIDSTNRRVAVACPRGDMLTFWHLDKDEFVSEHRLSDGAGVALAGDAFMATNGKGQVFNTTDASRLLLNKHANLQWDNHVNPLFS